MQLEDFLFKRKVSNARFFLWVLISRFKLLCEMLECFGCKAADCLKVACVFDCLLIFFEKACLAACSCMMRASRLYRLSENVKGE